jgi:hypothetical protein
MLRSSVETCAWSQITENRAGHRPGPRNDRRHPRPFACRRRAVRRQRRTVVITCVMAGEGRPSTSVLQNVERGKTGTRPDRCHGPSHCASACQGRRQSLRSDAGPNREPTSNSPYARLGRIVERIVHRPYAANADNGRLGMTANHPVVMRRAGDPADEAAGRHRNTSSGVKIGSAVAPPCARYDDA